MPASGGVLEFPLSTVRYIGSPNDGNYEVLVDRAARAPYKLDARNDIVNHSPDGVAWGYNGSGPAQCAIAILADYLSEGKNPKYIRPAVLDDFGVVAREEQLPLLAAIQFYQSFKSAVIANFSMDDGWELTGDRIKEVLEKLVERGY